MTGRLLWLLRISMGVEMALLLITGFQLYLVMGDHPDEMWSMSDKGLEILSHLDLAAYFITGILFLIWLSRANRNCHGFGAQGMEFTPGWAAGWYFVPIANLVMPYRSMKEMWQVSTNPENWKAVKPSVLLPVWWTLWLISSFVYSFVYLGSLNDYPIILTVFFMIAISLEISLCVVAILLVKSIFAKQEALVTMPD